MGAEPAIHCQLAGLRPASASTGVSQNQCSPRHQSISRCFTSNDATRAKKSVRRYLSAGGAAIPVIRPPRELIGNKTGSRTLRGNLASS
jgi:hypothetical protein